MATMAPGLDDNPGDIAGLLDGIAAQLTPQPNPAGALLTMLQVARLQADKLTGHDASWVNDIRNALNDLIEGVEGEVYRL